MDEQKQTQLEIDLSHEVAQGTYANLTIIAHSTSEFIIDFIRLMPGVTKPEVKSRIILTPENAKRLMLALQDNIWKYEQDNGTIRLASENQQPTGFPIDLEPRGQAWITAGIFFFLSPNRDRKSFYQFNISSITGISTSGLTSGNTKRISFSSSSSLWVTLALALPNRNSERSCKNCAYFTLPAYPFNNNLPNG